MNTQRKHKMFDSSLLHFLTIALTVSCNAVAVGIGQGLTTVTAIQAIKIQPGARTEISRTLMLGMALSETSAIIGLIIALIILFGSPTILSNTTEFMHYSELGIAAAIGIAGTVVGIAVSLPAQAACLATARQPFFSQKILLIMLLTQSLMQTPIIFAFIVALLIKFQAATAASLTDSMRLIGAGLCIGLGSVGPAIGLGIFAKKACQALGINRYAYSEVFSFTLMSQAIIESPIILSLVISLMLIGYKISETSQALHGIPLLSAGIVMGLGTLGVGIASGRTGSQACKAIGIKPEEYNITSRTSIIAQVLIETCSLYAFLIALFLILL